jgi:hypothetical protein
MHGIESVGSFIEPFNRGGNVAGLVERLRRNFVGLQNARNCNPDQQRHDQKDIAIALQIDCLGECRSIADCSGVETPTSGACGKEIPKGF